jgi:hypothetical protein
VHRFRDRQRRGDHGPVCGVLHRQTLQHAGGEHAVETVAGARGVDDLDGGGRHEDRRVVIAMDHRALGASGLDDDDAVGHAAHRRPLALVGVT